MDEILDIVDLVADFGAEGIMMWILRIIGLLAFLVGIGLWVFTDMGVLVLPAILIFAGLVLVVVPQVALTLIELSG